MKITKTIAFLAVVGLCSLSHGAARTFTLNSGGASGANPVRSLATVGTYNFSYVDTGFDNNQVGPGEITGTFSLTHTSFPGVTFTLDTMAHSVGAGYSLFFKGDDSPNSFLDVKLNGVFAGQPSGADLPDGTDSIVQVNAYPNGVFDSTKFISNASVTIATVPEPSVFGFGAVALAIAGAGRWVRRRFYVS